MQKPLIFKNKRFKNTIFEDKPLSSKSYVLAFVMLVVCFILPIAGIYYICVELLDVYGLKSTYHKYTQNLISEEKFLYPLRVEAQAPCYIVGTSRTRYMDYDKLSTYFKRHCVRLGISSAVLEEWIFLIQKIKAHKSHFILGLDVFSLNTNGFGTQNRGRIQQAWDITLGTFPLKAPIKALLNEREADTFFADFNHKNYTFSPQSIGRDFFINPNEWHPHYVYYEIDFEKIHALAQLITSQDIIILFPKYFAYYHFFQKYNEIQSQYFKAVTYLVKHTQAQVWSFYGINSITLNPTNFDDSGWHFKTKIGNLIMSRIFNDADIEVPTDFGVLLTKDNVDSYLALLSKQIQDSPYVQPLYAYNHIEQSQK